MFRATTILSLLAFLLVPALDQVACTFCGPSPETTATAKPVPHTEDGCLLKDGFERTSPSSEDEPVHIHFCLLHATSVHLTQGMLLGFEAQYGELGFSRESIDDLFHPEFFHPPIAV